MMITIWWYANVFLYKYPKLYVHLYQYELVDICLILWVKDQHYLILWLKLSQLALCSLSNPHPCKVIFVCVTFIFLSLQSAPGSYFFLRLY